MLSARYNYNTHSLRGHVRAPVRADRTSLPNTILQQPRVRNLASYPVSTANRFLAAEPVVVVQLPARVEYLEEVREVEHVAACEANQRLHLVLRERLTALRAVARFRRFVRVARLLCVRLEKVLFDVLSTDRRRNNVSDLDVDMLRGLNDDLELNTLALTLPQFVLGGGDFATEHLCHARADAVLDFVLLHNVLQAFAKTLNLEPFRDASDEFDGVDGRADFLEKTANEARLVHAIVQKVLPQVRVVLQFGKVDGLLDVFESVNDEVECTLHLARLGVEVHQFIVVLVLLALLYRLRLLVLNRRAEGILLTFSNVYEVDDRKKLISRDWSYLANS